MTRSYGQSLIDLADDMAREREAYPPRPARCDYRLRPAGETYTRSCKRAAGPSGYCWQHNEEVRP